MNAGAAQARDVGEGGAEAGAQVVELPKPTPPVIQLTGEERLRLENLQLKMELAKRQFGALMQELGREQERVAGEVSERTGANLRDYEVDLQSGACRRRENGDERTR